jgi:hypothetical protein
MNEQWEMCLIDTWGKKIYSPGENIKYTEFTVDTPKRWEERDDAIKDLLTQGWEPFAATEAAAEPYSVSKFYFRRRVS